MAGGDFKSVAALRLDGRGVRPYTSLKNLLFFMVLTYSLMSKSTTLRANPTGQLPCLARNLDEGLL